MIATSRKQRAIHRRERLAELAAMDARRRCSFCRQALGSGRFVLAGDVRVFCSSDCLEDALERDEQEALRRMAIAGR